MSHHRGYFNGADSSRNGSGGGRSSRDANHFSISQADFERESLLKRRRQLSPPRSPAARRSVSRRTTSQTAVNGNGNANTGDGSIGIRTRSKSKSRAPESTLRRLPSVSGQEFFVLGRYEKTRGPPPLVRSQTRSPSVDRHRPPVVEERGRKRAPSTSSRRASNPEPEMRRAPSKSVARAAEKSSHKKRDRERSKSKSRKRTSSRRRSSSRSSSSSRDSSRSPSRSRKSSRSVSKRHRSASKSVAKTSKTTSRKAAPSASATSDRRASAVTSSSSVDQELQRSIDKNETNLKQAKSNLVELEKQLAALQEQVDTKKYEVNDLQIAVDSLHKRRELQKEFLRKNSATSSIREPSPPPPPRPRREPSPVTNSRSSRDHPSSSKRPCIIDEEEDDDDDDSDVEIIDKPTVRVKREVRDDPKSSSRSASTSTATAADSASSSYLRSEPPPPPPATPTSNANKVSPDPMSDFFWGRVDIAKLLVQPRIRTIPDGSARKGRHLMFNPKQQDVFATGSDDGGVILWNYKRKEQEISKVVSLDPSSFRKDNHCAESMAWSPDGQRLAIAFRDAIDSMGEFCVIRLHELALTGSNEPQKLPRDRVQNKSTTLHPRGISAIEWVPGGYGDHKGARGVVTAGSDHAVVLWEEHKGQTDYKWRILHRDHRSDIRSICMHSQGNAIYTGALDGQVVRYDMNSQRAHTIMERRRPQISKINAVVENPHNPNLLLVSSVEQSEHNLLLHDLRVRYDDKRHDTMTLSWLRSSDAKSMSQYIVPRWSSGGFHVSCGSTSGLVNVWDVRVRGPKYPNVLPQQSISVHQKQVLHATWHPRYDAMFSVSHDRTIGLLTFR